MRTVKTRIDQLERAIQPEPAGRVIGRLDLIGEDDQPPSGMVKVAGERMTEAEFRQRYPSGLLIVVGEGETDENYQ